MADEEKIESSETSDVPVEFDKAMDAIEEENAAPEETPDGDKTDAPEIVSDGETLDETTDSEEPEIDTEEAPDALKDIEPEVLDVLGEHYTNEEIVELAKTKPELLDEVRVLLEDEKAGAPVDRKPAESEPEFEELKFDLDADEVGEKTKAAIDQITKVLNEQRRGLSEERGRLQVERDIAFSGRIDSCFDKFTKDIPDLGKTGKLTKRQKENREIWYEQARTESDRRGIPIERAIEKRMSEIKAPANPKIAEQNLLNELEKDKKRHINRPTRRKSADFKSRKFSSEKERVTALMDEAHRQAGDEN